MSCPDDAVLLAFADRELGEEEESTLAEHLDRCGDCRAVVAEAARRSRSSEASPTDGMPQRNRKAGADPLQRGESVGRYLILHRLGEGGMGIVYAAHDPEIDRKVALKLLHPHVSESGSARLLREAQALARVNHPNVIGVYDVGTFRGHGFIAVEYVEGMTLSEWMRQKPRRRRELLDAFVLAGRGLAAAHAAGLVHRDFKPSNVLVDSGGGVKVVDFGLARTSLDDPGEVTTPSPREGAPSSSAPRLTATGLLVGTPAYMSPEQRTGASVDTRADQYSFCLALYEALRGGRDALPTGATPVGSRQKREGDAVQEGSGSVRLPRRLLRALHRGMSPRPEDRFPSMPALLATLERRNWAARHAVAAASLLSAVAMAVVLALSIGAPEPCQGAERKLLGAWDPGTRTAMKRSLLATKAPFAPVVATRVGTLLDQYARAWVAEHREACESTRLRGEQSESRLDQRISCLSRRLKELGATTVLLAHANASIVERAVRMVSELRRPEVCRAPWMIRVALPPPSDPRRRDRVDALHQQLAELDAARRAGRYAGSIAVARKAVRAAHDVDYRPLEAEALALLGEMQESGGDIRQAEPNLVAAARAALASGHDLVYVEVAIRLVRLLGYRKRDHQRAQSWAADAAAMLERMGGDQVLGGKLHVRVGRLFHQLGHYPMALDQYERATAMLRAALGPDHLLVAEALRDHSLTLWRLGRYADAEKLLRQCLSLQEMAHGPDHPEVAHSLNGLGLVRWKQGDLEAALLLHQRALAIREKALAPGHPDISTSLNNLGLVLRHLGRYREAAAHYRRALAMREKLHGRVHRGVASVLGNLAAVLTEQGNYEEALQLNSRAYRIQVKLEGPRHPVLAYALANQGRLLFLLGRVEEAIPFYERALNRFETGMRRGHPDAAHALVLLGEAHLVRGRLDLARDLFQRTLKRTQRSRRQRSLFAKALSGLGRTALARGRFVEAVGYLERSVAIRARSRRDKLHRSVAEFALARALWKANRDRTRAVRLAKRARASFASERGGRNRELGAATRWLQRHRL